MYTHTHHGTHSLSLGVKDRTHDASSMQSSNRLATLPAFTMAQGLVPCKCTPNLPTTTLPTKVRWLNKSGRLPMDMIIPPLWLKIQLESNPLKSRIVVQILAVNSQVTTQASSDIYLAYPPCPLYSTQVLQQTSCHVLSKRTWSTDTHVSVEQALKQFTHTGCDISSRTCKVWRWNGQQLGHDAAYLNERSTEEPLRRSALSVCPCGDAWGASPPIRNRLSLGPRKAPKGTKVTSAKCHLCAYYPSVAWIGEASRACGL